MTDQAKPAPTPDSALIDKVEKAAEQAATRGVEKAVADVYATYGVRVLRYEAITIGGSVTGGILAALLIWAGLKAVGRLFARKA